MLIGLEDLPTHLRAHIADMRECVRLALADFIAVHAPLRHRYSGRTEASIIHDYMADFAKERFPWKLRRNLFLLTLDDCRVKLKKLDGRHRARNIQTNLVLQFDHQWPMRLFDDLDVTHLYLGYQRDPVEITNSSIWLVRPDGNRTAWAVELTDDAGESAMEFAVMAATDPNAETSVKRVKQKKVAAREAAQTASGEKAE